MKVCKIAFYKGGKGYCFSYEGLNLNIGDKVVVETIRGLEVGFVKLLDIECPENLLDDVKSVLRIATGEDLVQYDANEKDKVETINQVKEIVRQSGLEMKIVDTEYTLDRQKLLISFESEERVDFRQLVKDLASVFKTRIELRQIGPRDGAKKIGGLGPCGYCLCCAKFIEDFENVSIKMAKCQNLSLNPQKINGCCGKLLCCLKNENEVYEYYREGLPEVNDMVELEAGMAKVVAVDILKQQIKANMIDSDGFVQVGIKDIKKIISRKAKAQAK